MTKSYYALESIKQRVFNDLNGHKDIDVAQKARINNTSISKIRNGRLPFSLNTFERLLMAGYLNLDNYPEMSELPDTILNNLRRIDAMNKLTRAA